MCYSDSTDPKLACAAAHSQGPFVCDICEATYHNDEQNLELHKKIMHKISVSEENKEKEDHQEEENHLVDNAFHVLGKSLRFFESLDEKKEEKEDDGFDQGVTAWRQYEPLRETSKPNKGRRPGLTRWVSARATQRPTLSGFRAPSDTFWLV